MRIFLQTPPTEGSAPRFYQLILQKDLLGGWNLIRQWGWQGERGSSRQEHFDSLDEAQYSLQKYRDKQFEKGFRLMFAQGDEG